MWGKQFHKPPMTGNGSKISLFTLSSEAIAKSGDLLSFAVRNSSMCFFGSHPDKYSTGWWFGT